MRDITKPSPRDLMEELDPCRLKWERKAVPTEIEISGSESSRAGEGGWIKSCQMIGSNAA